MNRLIRRRVAPDNIHEPFMNREVVHGFEGPFAANAVVTVSATADPASELLGRRAEARVPLREASALQMIVCASASRQRAPAVVTRKNQAPDRLTWLAPVR
jgi:hypothetical protein